jgi:formylglycine-generating enzyme required for sulfatase activity
MGKYEVTQGEYFDVVGTNPSYSRNSTNALWGGTGGPVTNEVRHPVEHVSWFEATNYCALLTERELAAGRLPKGYVYRLPCCSGPSLSA